MGLKSIHLDVDKNKKPSLSDKLTSDCLSIEAVNKVILNPGTTTQINLLVKNSSSAGRMGRIYSNCDMSRGIRIQIVHPEVYVPPEGATITAAIIEVYSNATEGDCKISFSVS